MAKWVDRSTTIGKTAINFVQASVIPIQTNPDVPSSTTMRLIFLDFSEILQQLLNGLSSDFSSSATSRSVFTYLVKYLNNIWSLDSSATIRLTFVALTKTNIRWIAIKFGTDIQVPLRMNCNHFDEPLTFHIAPSSGQNFNLSNTLVYHQIPAKLMLLNRAPVKHPHVIIFIVSILACRC